MDLVEGLSVGGRPQVVLGASDRTPARSVLALYLFDLAGAGDNGVRYWGSITTDVVEPYGFCFARRGSEVHAIPVGHEGELRQFVLTVGADGKPAAREVRRAEIGTIFGRRAPPTRRRTPSTSPRRTSACGATDWIRPRRTRALIQPIAPGLLVADAEG